jgi:ribosomal protein L29
MLHKQHTYSTYQHTIAQLRTAVAKEQKEWAGNSSIDKRGIGFNLDNRFSVFSIKNLSFDAWCGYYGNSSCSTAFNLGDSDILEHYFVQYLNKHYQKIFAEMADMIEKDAEGAKNKRIEELRAELAKLEEVKK